MRKRNWELAVVVGVVAGVMTFAGSRVPLAASSSAAPLTAATSAPTRSLADPGEGNAPRGGANSDDGPAVVHEGNPEQGVSSDENADRLWQAQYNEGRAALGQGQNEQAEASFANALALAGGAGPEALHQTLDGLGEACHRQGNYQQASRYQAQAVEAVLKSPRPDLGTLGLYESRYSSTMQALDEPEQATEALSRARRAFDVAFTSGSPAHSEAMNRLAAQYRALGDNESAADLAI